VFAPTISNLTYSIVPDESHLFGTVTIAGTAVGASHAGTYSFTPGGMYSDQLGYMISYNGGSLTINPGAAHGHGFDRKQGLQRQRPSQCSPVARLLA
jgi:hypothetical protein